MPAPSAWGALAAPPEQDPNDFMGFLRQTRPELFQPGGGVPSPVMQAGAQLKAASAANNMGQAVHAAAGAPPPADPRGTMSGGTQALLDQLAGTQLESLKQQGLSVDALKEHLAQVQGADLPINFQPLAALTDAWSGSKMAPYAAPEETAATRAAQVQKLQDTIMKAQQGMSSDEVALLKDKLQAQYHSDDLTQREKDREVQRAAVNAQRETVRQDKLDKQGQQVLMHSQDQFNKDPTVVDATKKLAEVGNARDMLVAAKTNPAARNSIAIDMARLVVPSRLNETELSAFGGSKKASDKVSQALEDMKSGTLTDDNYKYLSDLVDTMERHNQATLQDRTEHHTRQYMQKTGKDFTAAATDLTGESFAPSSPKAGDIVDGHRFKGGDPGKASSWEVAK